MIRLGHEPLGRVMREVLAGLEVHPDAIHHVVSACLETSLRGVDSHGINLFPHYCRAVAAGRIKSRPRIAVSQRSGGCATLDADHAFGHHAGAEGIALAVELASEVGLGAVSVGGSTHFGAAAYFALQAARRGLVGLAFTNADALIRMAGGRAPYFGTNPICLCAPLVDEDPFCLDMATSTVSWNKIRNHQRAGEALGSGWACDAQGEPTIEPDAARMLEGLGGYKGYGLSMMVELLCGMLAGGPVGPELLAMYRAPIEARRSISHFFVALDLDRFVGREAFAARLQALVNDIRAQGTTEAPVMVPGDPEKQSKARRLVKGIPMDEALFEEFLARSAAFEEAIIS